MTRVIIESTQRKSLPTCHDRLPAWQSPLLFKNKKLGPTSLFDKSYVAHAVSKLWAPSFWAPPSLYINHNQTPSQIPNASKSPGRRTLFPPPRRAAVNGYLQFIGICRRRHRQTHPPRRKPSGIFVSCQGFIRSSKESVVLYLQLRRDGFRRRLVGH